MRTFILVFSFLFLVLGMDKVSYSKELKTIWGFSITIPENYTIEMTDLDSLMSKSRGSNVRVKYNLEEFENLMKNKQISEKILIDIYEKDSINRYNNHINLNFQSENIFLNLNDKKIYQLCTELKNLYSSMLKKEVTQYECFVNKNKFQNLSSAIQLKHSHRDEMLNYQYMVPYKRGYATFALLCENKNCDIMHDKLITIIRSLKN
jgi:hypothetical protein